MHGLRKIQAFPRIRSNQKNLDEETRYKSIKSRRLEEEEAHLVKKPILFRRIKGCRCRRLPLLFGRGEEEDGEG